MEQNYLTLLDYSQMTVQNSSWDHLMEMEVLISLVLFLEKLLETLHLCLRILLRFSQMVPPTMSMQEDLL